MIKTQRKHETMDKYVAGLKKKIRVWTIFDGTPREEQSVGSSNDEATSIAAPPSVPVLRAPADSLAQPPGAGQAGQPPLTTGLLPSDPAVVPQTRR